jgi:hypothetical protein
MNVDKPGWIDSKAIEFDDPVVIRQWLIFPVTTMAFRMVDPYKPLTFRRECGQLIRMVRNTGRTNFASTPPPMWGIPGFSPIRFLLPATVHDGIYSDHYIQISDDCGMTWQTVEVTRDWTDDLLAEMIEFDVNPGSAIIQRIYHRGVALFGRWCWDKPAKNPKPPRKPLRIALT